MKTLPHKEPFFAFAADCMLPITQGFCDFFEPLFPRLQKENSKEKAITSRNGRSIRVETSHE